MRVTLLRKGEHNEQRIQPAPNGISHATVSDVFFIEGGTERGLGSVMLVGYSHGERIVLEMTWQLFHSVTGAGMGSLGEPKGETLIIADFKGDPLP